jgi:amino acid adenylation domain-containing protein
VAAPVVQRLHSLAQGRGTTLFAALLAGVQLVLHRHSGARDLRVAIPVAGRTHPAMEEQIGFFVNTLIVRSQVDPAASAADWVAAVGRGLAEALEHQDCPFDRIVEHLNLPRDPSRMPVCDVTVVMADTGGPALELPGIGVRPFETGTSASKYDLHFVFEPAGAALRLSVVYNPDLFDAFRIERLGDHLLRLLDAIGQTAELPLCRLPMLGADEEAALLALGAARRTFEPRTLTQAFAAAAAAHPQRTAVSDSAGALRYDELLQHAQALALHLRRQGVRRGQPVGLLAARDRYALVGMLAITLAGAAYVPLDPAYPDERIAFILQDADIGVVLADPSLQARLGAQAPHCIALDGSWPPNARDDGDAELDPPDPDDVAYLIYTSGSTGQPKGVRVTHANITRLFDATRDDFTFSPDDVWSVFHSFSFDFSVWEIWGALLHGARAAIVPREVARMPDAFADFLSAQGVTMLSQTPSAFAALVAAQQGSGWPLRHALRAIVFGGEALDPALLAPWMAQYGDEAPALVNMYGITETTVHVTLRRLRQSDLGARSLIGRPLADLSLVLLDEAGCLVPAGVTGEIHVGGAGVALGYHRRPELSAQRFIEHPQAGPAVRLYRSGDLARWGTDGELEYLGRRDHQVKLRGYRIELGEIEAALQTLPGVDQALVQVLPTTGGQLLLAFVRGQGEPAAWRSTLARRLPDYMVPARVIILPAFPLTEHGKVDRERLLQAAREEAVDAGRGAAASRGAVPAAVEPLSALERKVAEALAALLGRPATEPETNFFDLGADSLLLVRLHAALKAKLERDFPLVWLYQYPNLRALASALAHAMGEEGDGSLHVQGQGQAHVEAQMQDAAGEAAERASERAAQRRAARSRRPSGTMS